MKNIVGLMLMQVIEGVMMALVKVNGLWNFRENKPGRYPNCLQITCRAEVLDGETEWSALERVVRKELGDWFADYYRDYAGNSFRQISITDNGTTKVSMYALVLPEEFDVESGIKLSPSTAGLLPLDVVVLNDLVATTEEMEHCGPMDASVLAMSEEDIEVLRGAFKVSQWTNV